MAAKAPFRVEAVLPVPASQLFLERDSAAFRSLLSKMLKIGQLEFNDLWREGTSSYVRMITKPEFGSWVPKGVANQLSSGQLEFHDVIEYNPTFISSPPFKIFVRTESPFLKDKLDVRMTLTIEELDNNSCRQVLEGHIRVRMFGVGRIVETIVKDSLQKTYKKLPEIVRRWQLFREEALRSGDEKQLLLGRPPVGCEVQWIREEVVQILKEPLPECDGTTTPISALYLMPGTSETSDDSPAAFTRTQQHCWQQQQQQNAAAEVPEVEAAAAGEQQQEQAQVEPASAEELLRAKRCTMSVKMSGPSVSEYYDARECLQDSEPCAAAAASSSKLLDTAPSPVQPPPAGLGAAEQEEEGPRYGLAALAAAVLARGSHHRRAISDTSATSTDTPTTGEEAPAARQQHTSRRLWRRFNRDYGEWESYWKEMGVEQEEKKGEPASGGIVSRVLDTAEEMLKTSYYSTSLVLALFFLRVGYLHVEPEPNADPHDERTRQHTTHRHIRTCSSGSGAMGSSHDAGNSQESPAHAQSLARVAQVVGSRMVSGSRAVAKAPVRAVVAAGSGLAAAGTSVRQASNNWADLFSSRLLAGGARSSLERGCSTDGGSRNSTAAAVLPSQPSVQQPVAEPVVVAASQPGASTSSSWAAAVCHRKTMSLDTGKAAAAYRAAAVAMAAHERQQQELDGIAAAPAVHVGESPSKALQRRPSNMAAVAAMASMERKEKRVQPLGGHARMSCFTICHRHPAVKD